MAPIAGLPLKIAGPAAAAGLAYLNARWNLSHDFLLMRWLITGSVKTLLREKRGDINFFYVLEQHALDKRTANVLFLMYEGRSWTYREVYDTVLRWAAWLKDNYTIAPGEIVAMDAMNSPMFVFLWFSLWSLGARPAFINYNLTGKPLLHCVKVSTSRLLFVDAEVRDKFTQEVLDELSDSAFRNGKGPVETTFLTTTVLSDVDTCQPYRAPNSARSGCTGPDMALLIYTSGTTGLPKPGIVSWQKIILGGYFVSNWLGMTAKDRFYSPMPLYHSSAAVLGLCSALTAGTTFVIGHKFSTKLFWQDVRQHDVTIIQYVGETCRYLLAAAPDAQDKNHKVRLAFGNGLRPDIWNKFKERFGIEAIGEFYAATEGPSATWNLSRNEYSRGAVGRNGALAHLIMSRQLAVVQVDHETELPFRDPKTGFCVECQDGEPGELLYKLDPENVSAKFQGYFGNDKATEGKVLRNVLQKGDLFYRTGDVLLYDKKGGRWYFKDRIGDTFRWKSENVSTAEVSEVLGSHPSVSEANVYGIELPNHDGRAGCATIVLHEGKTMDDKLAHSLAQSALGVLPRFAVPIFLRFTKAVEVTGTMKQQKHVLRNQGIDPSKTGSDELWWLPPGGSKYERYDNGIWNKIGEGQVKL